MAKACGVCGTVHDDGDCPLGGGGGRRRKKDQPKVPAHTHKWKWKRRSRPIDNTRPYDEYFCTFPGCNATEQRPV